MISGRDALQRLDGAVERARGDFDAAVIAADGQTKRRGDLLRMRAGGYREFARIRLDVLKEGTAAQLSAAEAQAAKLLEDHKEFVATIGGKVETAEAAVAEVEARRTMASDAAEQALQAYEAQVAATEARLQTDTAYLALKSAFEEARAVSARSAQKLELAKADRTEKGAPYESDPLFSYLWDRKFRTPDYHGGGVTSALDNWVAKTCGYDAAYLNYARLVELPDRLAEHAARVKLDEAEAEAAIGRYESSALEADGANALSAKLKDARDAVAAIDAELAGAEATRADLRAQQEKAATGDSGPQEEARRVIENTLAKASFPDLRVLAAETTTLDDDKIVDALVRLRTEELQLEVDWRNVEAVPARRRASVDALELVRQRYKQAKLDGPYVSVARAAFDAAIMAYGQGPRPDAEALWRAILAAVRQAPGPDDTYFGGPRRRRSIGMSPVEGMIVGAVLGQALGGGRHWGGGGWSGGGGGFGGDLAAATAAAASRPAGGSSSLVVPGLACLHSLEHRRAFFHEGFRGFGMIGRRCAARLVLRFGVEVECKVAALGNVEAFLHQAERDAGAVGEAFGQRHGFILQLNWIDRTGDDAETFSLLRQDHVRQEVEFARLGRADKLGHEIRPAEIAWQGHLCKRCGDLRAPRSDAEVAGQRNREAGAGRGAGNSRDGDLRHFVEPARDLHPLAQRMSRIFRGPSAIGAAFVPGETLDVAPRAECVAGARKDDRSNGGVSG